MALSQAVLSELLDAFRVGEGGDLVRDAVRLVMQELIEVEAGVRRDGHFMHVGGVVPDGFTH